MVCYYCFVSTQLSSSSSGIVVSFPVSLSAATATLAHLAHGRVHVAKRTGPESAPSAVILLARCGGEFDWRRFDLMEAVHTSGFVTTLVIECDRPDATVSVAERLAYAYGGLDFLLSSRAAPWVALLDRSNVFLLLHHDDEKREVYRAWMDHYEASRTHAFGGLARMPQ